ncbi:MAG: RNA methyltransferase [Bacteroidota bacterium]
MLSKSTIQYLKGLKEKSNRYSEGFFLAEGSKSAIEFLASNLHIEAIYATMDWALMFPQYKNDVRLQIISSKEIEQISSLKSTRDVVLQIAFQENKIEQINLQSKLHLVLNDIQDPGNLGTIIRIADWYGIKNVVCSEGTADCYNNKCIQATMGSIARVNVFYTDLLNWLPNIKLPIYGAVMDGKNINSVGFENEGLLLIGNEGKGINSSLMPYISEPISIKRVGLAESLNAAIATAIICDRFLNN